MNKKNFKKNDDLKEALLAAPMLLVFATASRTYPDATAAEILSEVEKAENFSEIAFEKYDLMPIHRSAVRRMVDYDMDGLQSDKGNFTCICPFHPDNSEGSLIITSNSGGKNLWKCFACGAGFDTIQFEMKYFNLGFRDALFHLAYRLGYIDEKSMKSKSSKLNVSAVKKHAPKKKRVEMQLADEDVISNVYKAMQKLYPLASSHKKHLVSNRRLSESDFDQYFTFPSRDTDVSSEVYFYLLKTVCEKVYKKPFSTVTEEERGMAEKSKGMIKLKEQFKNVPGFYFNVSKNQVEWIYKSGLGLLATDDRGIVRGVQVQQMDPHAKGPKYVWWSSQIKLGEPGFEGGSSAGSPGGVIFPKDPYGLNGDIDPNKAQIVVTEGKYKAEALARQGKLAVYVSGVSTWRSIIPIIERLCLDRKKIFVAFDADSLGNTAVHTQLREMCLAFQSMGLKPMLLTWSKSLGKGFDDLLKAEGFANYKYFLKIIEFDAFEVLFDKEVATLLNKAGVASISELSKELKPRFTGALQTSMESALGLLDEL